MLRKCRPQAGISIDTATSTTTLAGTIVIDARGAVTFHPDAVAYTDDAESGHLSVPGWIGGMTWARRQGHASGADWSICIGDVIADAVRDGRIQQRPLALSPLRHA